MSAIIYKGHVQCLILKVSGQVPTIPSPDTLTPLNDGWNNLTDILVGEFALNEVDGKLFKRSQLGIQEITSGGSDTIIVQTDAEWAIDSTIYPETKILITSDSFFSGTNVRAFKIPNGINIWADLDYLPDAVALALQALVDANAYTDSQVSSITAVQSVTGEFVDNTDPDNPVVISSIKTKSAADWSADATIYPINYVLITNDLFFTGTDVRKFKLADGVQAHAQLDYFPDPGTKQPLNSILTQLSGISFANGDFIKYVGTSLVNRTTAQVKSDLGIATDIAASLASAQTYTDNAVAGLKWKQTARAATTANITLSGAQTIDGISIIAGDRVLVKDQLIASQNGIYLCAAGAWTRSTDADSATELQGAILSVDEGTTNGDTTWRQTADSITLGSTSITWVQYGAATPDATTTTKGKAKLYTSTGSNTDGAMDQNSITNALALKQNSLSKATTSEINTGTDNDKYIVSDQLETSKYLNQSGSKISATAAGTNTYTATISPAITSYVNTQRFFILFTNGNNTAATLNLNGLGAKPIVKKGNVALAPGDIPAGATMVLAYDGTNFQITNSIPIYDWVPLFFNTTVYNPVSSDTVYSGVYGNAVSTSATGRQGGLTEGILSEIRIFSVWAGASGTGKPSIRLRTDNTTDYEIDAAYDITRTANIGYIDYYTIVSPITISKTSKYSGKIVSPTYVTAPSAWLFRVEGKIERK